MIALGEGLRIWATGHLFKNDALTVEGPYAYLRHPLYLGTLLIACGFGVMARGGLTLALLGVFLVSYFGYYMPYKNRIESARLEALYGDAFRRYATAVPSLLPRLAMEAVVDAGSRRIVPVIVAVCLFSLLVIDSCTACASIPLSVNGESIEIPTAAGVNGMVMFVMLSLWSIVLAVILASDHLAHPISAGSAKRPIGMALLMSAIT